MEGTFKQAGKEIDGSKYQITGHFEPGNIICPKGHVMRMELISRGMPEVLYACRFLGCEYENVIYRAHKPSIHLEAVTDK
jgi:hypothetical protein